MDGTICLPTVAEPLEIHGQPSSARPHDAAHHHASKPPDRSSPYEAWLHQPARTKIRRPLSPICPMIIGERPPPPAFWHREEVKRFFPLAGSIALHLAIITFGLMTFRAERPRVRGGIPIAGTITAAESRSTIENVTPQIAPVAAEMFADATKVDRVFPMPHDPNVSAEPENPADLTSSAMLPPSDSDETALMIGVGPQSVALLPVKAQPPDGSTAVTSPDAPAKVAAGANEAKFFGVQGTGQAVVYVCDASGSMMGTNDVIVNQLQRALLAMHSTQVFNVIFFSGRSKPVVFDARDMIPADANNKLAACGFAKRYSCGGNSKGLPAIRSALQRNPDLMYLVTDGDFDDSDAIISTIRTMNHDGFTKINVILVSGAQQDPSGYRFLKQIADENGGTCRIVNPNSL
ncbi:MAG: hypothetical protein H7Z14_12855 [Anaerolineae bacterium]|nr:hypothetical protein [Phycisphaerae bacterium]